MVSIGKVKGDIYKKIEKNVGVNQLNAHFFIVRKK